MKNLAIGVIIGVLISAVVFYPLLKLEQNNKFHFGQSQGFVNGQWKAIESLEPFLDQVSSEKEAKILFSAKTSDIVVFEENGLKVIGLRK